MAPELVVFLFLWVLRCRLGPVQSLHFKVPGSSRTVFLTMPADLGHNCGEWVECIGLASGCGEQEVGVANGSGWNLWVWL